MPPRKLRAYYAHFRTQVIRGFLAIIPLVLSFLVLRFLYLAIDQRVARLLYRLIGINIPGMGILLVIVLLYLAGLAASNLVGRTVLGLIDRLMHSIPLVRLTYKVGRQVATVLSLRQDKVFRRAVLVEYLKSGIWTVGFVTGEVIDRAGGGKLLKVFIPTPPNPASGTMVLVREEQTRDPRWTIEQAVETVVSGGIIGPVELG